MGEETAQVVGAAVAPGWYEDPLDTRQFRWWDGARWTHAITRDRSTIVGTDSYFDGVLRKMDRVFENRQPWGAPTPVHVPKGRFAAVDKPVAAGWYQDPMDKEQFRYWTGEVWAHDIVRKDETAKGQKWYLAFDQLADETLISAERIFRNKQALEPPKQTKPSLAPAVSVPHRTCARCAAQIDFDVTFCPRCGAKQSELSTTELASVITQLHQLAAVKKPEDTQPCFGFAFLGFLFPLIGLFLYAVWYKDRPGPAASAGKGALAGVIVELAAALLWLILLRVGAGYLM
ncbi:MAG: DUF2510 domain-containing protein [Actinomycetia bacterium]|nr:DUF2510 domain-containing protein [Actinomycetes bacterium]